MRNRWNYFSPILDYLGVLFWVFGLLLLIPLVVLGIFSGGVRPETSIWTFIIPAAIALLIAMMLKLDFNFRPLDTRRAMILCALGWICISAVGAIPFVIGLKISYLDAYFETVAGFTTTGITILTGLDSMPLSILFWRSFTQWLGGLGIITFFLVIIFAGSSAHTLFSAEGHKIFSKRPRPSLFTTVKILWSIYIGYTIMIAAALWLAGLGPYDAVSHALTALSTGGFSTYDASIAYFRDSGYTHYILIEYIVTFGMLLGGINFFVHYRVVTGKLNALWDSFEIRLWWYLVGGATGLIIIDRIAMFGITGFHDTFRASLFQVISLITTTGFGTVDISTNYFPTMSKLIFLVLMVIGGCVGSTGGGIKVMRIGILIKMMTRQIRRLIYGPAAVNPVVVDGDVIGQEEIRRVAALFFAWVMLLFIGGAITAILAPKFGPAEAASGMFSALGNIGPCFIPAADFPTLNPFVKITYIFGMLAGRLEILPVLLLFSPRTWTK